MHDLVIHPRDDIAVIGTHGRGMWALDVRLIRDVANVNPDSECEILEFENCKLPRGTNYWYRRSAKHLNAPFYLKSSGKTVAKIINADNETVKEFEIEGVKGLNFVKWDLMVDEENLVEAGNFKLQIEGSAFSVEKEFEVNEFGRD